ncbi:hypothetical protein D9757_007116 [Collybiopsis confluens]|uniref:RRM domain-containing protein n=1 Tax=Collybiopsis confluens TaxID=2823264 RepID=A0A8H5HCI8_9AGAR|nr:hypothetical protein D9757_007116 [Collybiopsis confluens]
MSAPPSPDSLNDISCHSRQSSAQSSASIQSLHLASVPLSSFSSRAPVSPPSRQVTSPRRMDPRTSPESSTTSYRVYRNSQNATNGAVDHGESPVGEVVGLMRTLNLISSPTTSIIPEREIEEGEILQDAASYRSTRTSRQRGQSFGGSLPSSPEVLPLARGITSAAAITSVQTFSTLSSIPSLSSFHATSSSSSIPTSISNSGSTNDIAMSDSDSVQKVSLANVPQGSVNDPPFSSGTVSTSSHEPSTLRGKVPETGPIDLEALEKEPANDETAFPLNSDIPAHISGSSDDAASDVFYDSSDGQTKSPNVYINGLPPHFLEERLFELAKPFGDIRSVRCFTRHVGEKESGYGFVLFENVDSAEKCIESLRRYRNLHPTFSKASCSPPQSHKIPGMPYTQMSSQSGWTHESDNGPSLAHGAGKVIAAEESPKSHNGETFKVKMERLQDPNSTNLYIEGLPLSIDEPSLAALVSPHRIKSNRFFQTRLSNPPRIIAFVRLETRHGAEEAIERLHGRMVRGWNDPGSRISVRFADTSEQRELRRTERTVREDDTTSSARLTIAQAALLNLRGREQLRPNQTGFSAPPIGVGRQGHGSAPTANQVYNDFSSNAHDISSAAAGGYRGSASDLTSAAQLLAGINQGSRRNISPYHHTSSLPSVLGQTNQDLTPAVTALLDSLRGNGTPWTGHDARHGPQQCPLPTPRNAHAVLGDVDVNLAYPQQARSRAGGGVAQTRSGYTPAEELILNAHAQGRKGSSQRLYRQHGDDHADFNVGVRGHRSQASTMTFPHSQQQQGTSYYSSTGNLPVVVESEDYEGDHQPSKYLHSQLNGRARETAQIREAGLREPEGGGHQYQQFDHPNSNRSLTHHSNALHHNQQAHVRSTTLPPSTTPPAVALRHYQHNSMNIPKSRNIINDITSHTNSHTQPNPAYQHQSQQLHSKNRSTNTVSSISNDNKNHKNNHSNIHLYSDVSDIRILTEGGPYTNTAPVNHPQHRYRHDFTTKTNSDTNSKNNFNDGGYGDTRSFPGESELYGASQASPPLVSPALTYSSRGSSAALSPSTPYVGSFTSAQEQEAGEYQVQRAETEVANGR